MTEEARLHDAGADLRELEGLVRGWEPCYTFGVRYLREGPEWKATPADGGTPLTASSAQDLRKLLRQAAPVDRGAARG